MTYINIQTDFLELLMAKRDISNYLIEQHKLENEYELQDFISSIKLDKTIYVENINNIIPFSIYYTPNNNYIFYVSEKNNIDTLKHILEELKYDLTTLIKKDKYEIAQENILESSYFIIENDIYIKK